MPAATARPLVRRLNRRMFFPIFLKNVTTFCNMLKKIVDEINIS
jgi:hypothetical protein